MCECKKDDKYQVCQGPGSCKYCWKVWFLHPGWRFYGALKSTRIAKFNVDTETGDAPQQMTTVRCVFSSLQIKNRICLSSFIFGVKHLLQIESWLIVWNTEREPICLESWRKHIQSWQDLEVKSLCWQGYFNCHVWTGNLWVMWFMTNVTRPRCVWSVFKWISLTWSVHFAKLLWHLSQTYHLQSPQ